MEEKKLTDDTEINVGMIETALKCWRGKKACDLCVYDDRAMQDSERTCINLVAEDALDIIHRSQRKNEIQRKIIEYQNGLPDLVEQQKAEIERLTEERNEYKGLYETMYRKWSDLSDKEFNCDALRKEKNEYFDKAVELQKQADELKAENTELHKEHTILIAGSILQKQDIVKETAKEICLKIIKDQPQPIKEKWVEWFKKEYGIEVE